MSKTGLPLNVFELGRVPPSAAGGWVLFLETTQRSTQQFVGVILATTMLSVMLAGGYANLHWKNLLHFAVPVLKGVLPSTLPLAVSRQSEKARKTSALSDIIDLVEKELRITRRHILLGAHHRVAAISDL